MQVAALVGTTAGYAYARFRFPLKTFSLFALLFTRMLPTIVLIPALIAGESEIGRMVDAVRAVLGAVD